MVNATTINSEAEGTAEADARDWGPWYRPAWKWAAALVWAAVSFMSTGYGSAAALAGGAVGAVVGSILLVYILTRVSRALRE
jgi:predicted membrane protein